MQQRLPKLDTPHRYCQDCNQSNMLTRKIIAKQQRSQLYNNDSLLEHLQNWAVQLYVKR